jgi:hypothetical protein
MNSQELAASSLVAEQLSRGLVRMANFSEIGGPQESEMLMPGENGQLVSAVIHLAISEAGDLRFGQEE